MINAYVGYIRWGLLLIVFVVAGYKIFDFTVQMVRKLQGKETRLKLKDEYD